MPPSSSTPRTTRSKELHQYGAMRIPEPTNESYHILSTTDNYGSNFKLLGIEFDVALRMDKAVEDVVFAAGWKLKMLVRTRRFYTDGELVILYKSHLLSYLEYRTPAIYHATRDILHKLDRVQTKFLEDINITEELRGYQKFLRGSITEKYGTVPHRIIF